MIEAPEAGPVERPDATALSVEHVSARYPRAPYAALNDVSLRVAPGEIAVLLGANGSGKSTLLRVAAGILAPTEGDVRVAGHPVAGLDRRLLARLVAFVPQSEAVALGFRVREVVAMGRAPHQDGWMRERAEDRVAVEEAIARCDLAALAIRRVDELSAGEQRRVALARALAQRPRVLLLDEPAAFLDVRHRLDLHDLLAEVAVRDRVACVVAMHELDAAAHLGSQALLLRDGRVVAAGTPGEVMTPVRLREAFGAEVDVSVHAPSGRRYFVIRRSR
ncbi:MAG TPA: ABC transporter ATP-binding protein [Polyangiaceae bacterium]|nr:ABC transporter ATP-binding protein [Polyangiaceae bacterium]